MNIVSPGFFDTGMGAAPEVLEAAYDMAVLGRQGDPRELKGVRYVVLLAGEKWCSLFTPVSWIDLPVSCVGRVDVHDWSWCVPVLSTA